MSHVDTWDPKPGRPVQGEFTAIDTSADGVQISSIFPNLAKQMPNSTRSDILCSDQMVSCTTMTRLVRLGESK